MVGCALSERGELRKQTTHTHIHTHTHTHTPAPTPNTSRNTGAIAGWVGRCALQVKRKRVTERRRMEGGGGGAGGARVREEGARSCVKRASARWMRSATGRTWMHNSRRREGVDVARDN